MVQESQFLSVATILAETTKEVFEKLVKTPLTFGPPGFKEGKEIKGDVASILGLTGVRKISNEGGQDDSADYKAIFVLTWPLEAYIKASNLMLKEKYTKYQYEISDVGGEICNVIVGNAKPRLEQEGFTANLSIPSVIHGSKHRVHYPLGSTIVAVPLNSSYGDMTLEFGYAEGKKKKAS
tara:strand:- start:957 stop:1496 length:540 start_codon:yes stop_codon:yes gene_type:complete